MIYDATRPIYHGMKVFPGDPGVEFKKELAIDSDGVEVHRISLGTHTGTHVDAPSHIFKEGKTIDKIDPGVFWGDVRLYAVEGKDCIGVEEISLVKPGQRVIIKTGFSGHGGEEFYPYIMPEAARYLVNCGLTLLGIDTPSVDPPGTDQCHRILLGSGIVIVENIWLEGIPPGQYMMSCLPLLLLGTDGSPARVLLQEKKTR